MKWVVVRRDLLNSKMKTSPEIQETKCKLINIFDQEMKNNLIKS